MPLGIGKLTLKRKFPGKQYSDSSDLLRRARYRVIPNAPAGTTNNTQRSHDVLGQSRSHRA